MRLEQILAVTSPESDMR